MLILLKLMAWGLLIQSPEMPEKDLVPLIELIQKRAWVLQNPISREDAIELAWVVDETVTQYGLTPGLVLALVEFESRYVKKAKSHKKCKGLIQLSPGTARTAAQKLGMLVYDIYGITDNIRIGISYLVDLFMENGNMVTALTIYNRGWIKFVQGGKKHSNYAKSVVKRSKYLDSQLTKSKEYCSK